MNKSFGALKSILGHSMRAAILVGLAAGSGTAWADGEKVVPEKQPEQTPNPQTPNSGDLPPPQSDSDVQPEVATPGAPAEGVIEQAGAGGVTGYGRAGVLELGGSVGFLMATNLRQVNVSPTIGWFAADNFQLSGIMDLASISTDSDSATLFGALVEPSYHVPFSRTAFGFFGLGMGASYVTSLGTGFAMAPRLGANFIVGRSGILSPTVSWQYTTHDTMDLENTTLVAVSSALRMNIGYTVMW
jgi:hypothetical protein